MIADTQRLVVSVVPQHLLPSARGVLREKLGTLARQPIYGMRFDRYTPVNASLLERLRHACAMRGVLLLEPTSLKSVLLKFIEGIATLQGEINEFYAHFHVTRDLLELRNLVQVADLIVQSAQLRRESRGLHFSRDYPELAAPAAPTILVPPVVKRTAEKPSLRP